MARGRKKYVLCLIIGACLYVASIWYKSASQNQQGVVIPDGELHDEARAHQQLAIKKFARKSEVPRKVHVVNVQQKEHKPGEPVPFGLTVRRVVPFCKSKPSPLESVISAPEQVFQPLAQGNTQLFVYSAYHDSRSRGSIKIIATIDGHNRPSSTLYCQLWYRVDARVMFAAPAQFSSVPEGAGRRYDGGFLQCNNPSDEVPYAVSVVEDSCQHPNNVLKVMSIPPKPPSSVGPPTFATCITPLNLNYDKIHQLVEYFEVSRLLGANQFFFYNYTASPRASRIINHYVSKSMATVLQWHLPMKVHVWPIPPGYVEHIKYFGQMAALNECLYRTMLLGYHFAVFADLDELLLPHQDNTWAELIKRKGGSSVGGLVFRNTFFKTEWPDDPETAAQPEVVKLKAMTLLKTRRETTINAPGSRSKLIVRPERVNVMGVHNVWSGDQGITLSPEEGLCHHYRFWEGMGEKTFVVDKSAWRFRQPIIASMKAAYKELGIEV